MGDSLLLDRSSDIVEIETTIGQKYALPKYEFPVPEPLEDPNAKTMFTSTYKEIFDNHYQHKGDFQTFPKIPSPNDYGSYEEFLDNLNKWKHAVKKFSSQKCLPIPISHYIPRPCPPEIIPEADREDKTKMRKVQRNYDPLTSLPSPANQVAIETIIEGSEPIDEEGNLPYSGLNDKPVPISAHLSKNISWVSRLIPQKPEPFQFEYFDDYEEAMLRWAKNTNCEEFLPPSAEQVGMLSDIQPEGKLIIEPPHRPKDLIKMPQPLYNDKSISRESRRNIRRLSKIYSKFLKSSTEMKTTKSKGSQAPDFRAFTPAHASGVSANMIAEHYTQYGVPFTSLTTLTNTQIRRHEMMTRDVGFLAQPDMNEPGPINYKLEYLRLVNLIKTNVDAFLVTDISPRSFQHLLYKQIDDAKNTVGTVLSRHLTIEELAKKAALSTSPRFICRCAIIAQFFLGLKDRSDQVLKLDLSLLDRFVELVAFTSPFSVSLPPLPDDEIAAATEENKKSDQQIEQFASEFRQAQLLCCFQHVVFTAPDRFYPFLSVIRPLLHHCYEQIAKIVMSDVAFPLISDGFQSTNKNVHMFYFRLLRTIIHLQYSRLIRVFAIHDLFKFFQKCINHEDGMIRRDALSLWQLIMHSDTSLALRLQILSNTPSSTLKMLRDGPEIIRSNMFGVFALFRRNEAEFDYRPFPLPLYRTFMESLCADVANPMSVSVMELLLSAMTDAQSIYCRDRNELKEFANAFAQKYGPRMTQAKLDRCLKILYKNSLLERESVNMPIIWEYILSELQARETPMENRVSLWKAFRNAVLHQRGFISFILATPELCALLEKAFSNIDENVSNAMIIVMPDLAAPRRLADDQQITAQLAELFAKLSSVRIAGRLLAAFTSSHDTSMMARVHSALILFLKRLLTANEPYLVIFKDSISVPLRKEFETVKRMIVA